MSNNTDRFNIDDLKQLSDEEQVTVLSESVKLIEDEVYHRDLHIGRPKNYIRAGIVLAAFRLRDIPSNPKRIARFFNVDIRELILAYQHICRNIDFLSVLPTKWTVFLNKYSESLGLSQITLTTAFTMGQKGEENGILSGRKPRNYAVSCIYASVEYNDSEDTWVTQRKLSEVSDISRSTIRVTYKKILENYS